MKGFLKLRLFNYIFKINFFILLLLLSLFAFNANRYCVKGEIFTLGYLTGSQRRSGNFDYQRPGLTISGAISLAISKVNSEKLSKFGHTLKFLVAETYGEEISSIRQTASLWTKQISGYIGPQETCVHEGRMAAAFNLPMISYFCTHRDTSNKKDFPTFARTRPPDTQISKSVVSLLLAFNWTQVTFLYLDTVNDGYTPVAETILSILKLSGVNVRATLTWNTIYHHGFRANPFDSIVDRTYTNTRIYIILGHYYEHIGLMMALKHKGLLTNGEYFVIGVDIEQYDPKQPEKYFHGLLFENFDENLQNEFQDAFRSYLAIFPSAPVAFEKFAKEVNKYMELPPFNFPNPIGYFGGAKQIRAEAAYLYDAIHLYANAIIKVIENGGNPKNGTAIINAIKGSRYLSAMGLVTKNNNNNNFKMNEI